MAYYEGAYYEGALYEGVAAGVDFVGQGTIGTATYVGFAGTLILDRVLGGAVGTATYTGLAGTLLVGAGQALPAPQRGHGGGFDNIPGTARISPEDRKALREELEASYRRIVEGVVEEREDSKEVAQEAARLVRPYTRAKALIPQADAVRWNKAAKEAELLGAMVALAERQRLIEDEEAAILLLLAA